MTTSSPSLLASHGIRPTANRVLVARALAGAGRPLSLTELEARLGTVDKSAVFRTLATFRAHHLVHVIEGTGDVRYELCHASHADGDDDRHVHFFCERCHRAFCLEGTAPPPVALPPGYKQTAANYVVRGCCPQCAGVR
ncbi:MAG: transcriptional repressor [Bacteroidaceae bacterium]|nr:transcriptional repressor [Bacteroidaceae bacterium]